MGEALDRVELFAGLDEAALADLRALARPFEVAADALLFRQGDPPSGLFLVESGLLEIATRMPGDEAAWVSRIAPGEVVGEFALLDDGPRSATVRAVEDTSGLLIPARGFAAMLGEGRGGPVAAIDRLRGLVATRTRATLERLAQTSLAEASELRRSPPAIDPAPHVIDAEMLRSLGTFAELADVDCAELIAAGEGLSATRNTSLVEAGAKPDTLYLVVRGAVRAAFVRGALREQVTIHGPGEWAGLVAMIDRCEQPLALDAVEESILLRVNAAAFLRWREHPGRIGQVVLAAVDRQLVRDQRRANRHFGRAIALGRFNAAGSTT
ncbi:MAG: cyclic nucleotide-binding domain-containing protein [Novosphingobium sp.]|nr:cyclic nucleotide-binding domain-containing protein [Novosphingobium sp.]